LALLIALGAVAILAVACAGETVIETVVVEKVVPGEKVVETVVVEKVVPGEKVVETVVVEKVVTGEKVVETVVVEKVVEKIVVATATPVAATPVPTPTIAAAPTAVPPTAVPTVGPPVGTLTLALPTVGSPIFVNSLAPYPRGSFRVNWGVCETLATVDKDDATKIISQLADAWEVAPDGSKITFHIHPGVQFHKGWGEATAEDVAYSYNDAGADNPETTAGGGAALFVTYDPWVAVDTYTVDAPFDTPDSLPTRWGFIEGGPSGGQCILSKKVHDQLGQGPAVTTMVATGPWDPQVWTAGVRLEADAVKDHWRIIPGFDKLVILEVPEEQTRIAMMKTGQVDIVEASLKNIKELVALGMEANDTLGQFHNAAVFMGGNFWYDPAVHVFKGEPVNRRAGFKPDDDHPWIGDPNDPVRHERARKVRVAMAMAIDREAITETILGGLAPVAYIPSIPLAAPDWDDRWVVPYDPDGAKKLLTEAGYPDGFEFTFWIPNDFANVDVETALAIVAYWENIGIRANPNLIAYTAGRPNLMTKEQDAPWMWFMVGDAVDYNNAHVWSAKYGAHGAGWNGGVEIPELEEFYKRWETELGNREAQVAIFVERANWLRDWMPFITVADIPKLWVQNPNRVTGWQMFPRVEPGTPNNLELAQPMK